MCVSQTSSGSSAAEIGIHLARLSRKITMANEIAVDVFGLLTRNKYQLAACRNDDLSVCLLRWQITGIDAFESHRLRLHVLASTKWTPQLGGSSELLLTKRIVPADDVLRECLGASVRVAQRVSWTSSRFSVAEKKLSTTALSQQLPRRLVRG